MRHDTTAVASNVILDMVPVSVFVQDPTLRCREIRGAPFILPASHLLGRRFDQVLPAAQTQPIVAALQLGLATGLAQSCRTALDANGDEYIFDWTIRPILDDTGGVLAMVSTAADVTTQQRRESELALARDAALAIVQAQSALLASASHDLRQPMQGMRLYLDVLSSLSLATTAGAQAAELVERVSAVLTGCEGMIRNLFDRTALDRYGVQVNREAFAVDPLLRRILLEHQPVAATRQLRLRAVPSRAVAFSDPRLVERILRNLVSNAIRYTSRGGVLIGCRRHADGLSLEVWDTGQGIPADKQQLIFQDYTCLGIGTEGTGLGLSIVAGLTGLLGHSIDLRSVPNRGTVFKLRLPVAEG